jgi:hypothetical protein
MAKQRSKTQRPLAGAPDAAAQITQRRQRSEPGGATRDRAPASQSTRGVTPGESSGAQTNQAGAGSEVRSARDTDEESVS